MQQLMMFDLGSATSIEMPKRPVYRRVRGASDGPTPQQRELNLKKLLRKIAFRRRTKEAKGVGNDESWSTEGIVKIHQTLLADFEAKFPLTTNPRDQLDWWLWILGDKNEAFSFHDCLVVDGYTHPQDFIEECAKFAPAWVLEIIDLPADQQVARMQQLIEAKAEFSPARGQKDVSRFSDDDADCFDEDQIAA